MSTKPSNAGFSLTEVAIVCAIVAIVVAIVIPAYQDYRIRLRDIRAIDAFFDLKLKQVGDADFALPKGVWSQAHFVRAGGVDTLYAKLPSAYTYIGAPSRMNIDDTQHVYLALSVLKLEDVSQIFLGQEVIGSQKIKVSDRMQVQLESNDFEIQAEAPTLQAIRNKEITQWRWGIRAKRPGRHSLTIVVSALVTVSGAQAPLVLTTYTRTIEVEVTAKQVVWGFLKENAAWLWAPLVGLSGGVWWLVRLLLGAGHERKRSVGPSARRPSNRP